MHAACARSYTYTGFSARIHFQPFRHQTKYLVQRAPLIRPRCNAPSCYLSLHTSRHSPRVLESPPDCIDGRTTVALPHVRSWHASSRTARASAVSCS
eukprot:354917-Chlamydomonas_euryale.AAC.29